MGSGRWCGKLSSRRRTLTEEMLPSRISYDNIKRWKVERGADSYAILPSPNYVFWLLPLVLPFVAAFYWLIHYKFEVDDKGALLMADIILFGTSILLIATCVRSRFQVSRDLRPILVVKPSERALMLPRLSKTYQLDGAEQFFIAHDYFNDPYDTGFSELNFVEAVEGEESRTLLIHFLGRGWRFDKIGEELEELGVPFKAREHHR